jgi:hypothetical protein
MGLAQCRLLGPGICLWRRLITLIVLQVFLIRIFILCIQLCRKFFFRATSLCLVCSRGQVPREQHHVGPPLKDKFQIWQNLLYQVIDKSSKNNILYL